MLNLAAMTVNHASLFCECVRTRRHMAAFAARNTHLFSSELIYKAFLLEQDGKTKSWLALALGNLKFINASSDIQTWSGGVETEDEDRFWGVLGKNLICSDNDSSVVDRLLLSSDKLSVVSGLLESYHHTIKTEHTFKHIEKALMSGDAIKERWALVTISNSKNFKKWEYLLDLVRNSENSITREWAAWALSSASNSKIGNELYKCLNHEINPRVREWLYKAISVDFGQFAGQKLREMFLYEKDFMVKEGITQILLRDNTDINMETLKNWLKDCIDTADSLQTPEHEILVCQALKAFKSFPIKPEEFDWLTKLAINASKLIKLSICSIASDQLQDLVTTHRMGTYSKIGVLLEQEQRTFYEIDCWNKKLKVLFPAILSENLIQNYENGTAENVFQRATILGMRSSSAIFVSQRVHGVESEGNIFQIVDNK